MSHRYALVNRPPGIGCVPRGLEFTLEPRPPAGAPHHAHARHGILVSSRELTPDECRSFELAPLVDGAEHDALGERIAVGRMGDYAAEYIEVAADDPDSFREGVLTAIDRLDVGVVYSVADPGRLVSAVLHALRRMAGG